MKTMQNAECRRQKQARLAGSLALPVLVFCSAFCILHSAFAAAPEHCSQSSGTLGVGTPAPKPSIVIVVLDDCGVDKLPCYGIGCDAPSLPTIEGLASAGLRFAHAYAAPLCSPTRAMLQTGRYGFRTGMGNVIGNWQSLTEYDLPLAETTIAERLPRMRCGMAGKWHLASQISGGIAAPLNQGWDVFDGTMVNLQFGPQEGYYDWLRVTGGATVVETQYATTVEIDAAIAMAQNLPRPFVLLVALSAPHAPWHYPPAGLYDVQLAGDPDANPPPFFNAALQAADAELARLLAVLPEETLGFLLGDNGTPGQAMCGPFDPEKEKGTVYEGGVRVPLIAWGAGVTPGVCDALVHAPLDVYASVLRAGGFLGPLRDGVALQPYLSDAQHAPLRDSIYVEVFKPNGFVTHTTYDRAVRDTRWKLVERSGFAAELYDLEADPYEAVDRAADGIDGEEQAAIDQLENLWPQ